ncbi:cupin domain-containing protein [Brevibacillus sp. H7]|uniref:cupin domain-containing protein n=1 Tax=Brevibacillus sp. H7 TaxID=3349138 RepID=UPI0037F9488F
MTLYMDYKSPFAQFFDDVNNNLLVQKDHQNYINVLSTQQLNTLDHVSLLDIFLSTGNVVEPHYHQNAAELVWHWEIGTRENTHLLAIFNAPIPEVILGSDLLRLTPSEVLAYTYCLNEAKVKNTLAPIRSTTFIGPPLGCHQGQGQGYQPCADAPNPYEYCHQQPIQQQDW